MNTMEKYSVSARAMDWVAAFWEGKAYAHTTPEPDDMPPPKNDPIPQEVPQPDPVPVQEPIPHQEPVRGVE